MKKIIQFSLILVFIWSCGAGPDKREESHSGRYLLTEMDSICYAYGTYFSQKAMRSRLPLSAKAMKKGYLEAKAGTSYVKRTNATFVVGKLRRDFREKQMTNPPKAKLDSLSYAVGGELFFQLNASDPDIKEIALFKALEDNLERGTGALSLQQTRKLMAKFRHKAEEAMAKKNQAVALENRAEGQNFLKEKAKEAGVISTSSGLLYKVIKTGKGATPNPTDKVSVHYEGRLINGTIFDSSIQRGQPAEFRLNRVIRGWTEGLQLMKTGAKYQFYIPVDLAYGDRGSGANVPPGATLIFDVELLKVIR